MNEAARLPAGTVLGSGGATDAARLVERCSEAAFAVDGNLRVVGWNEPAARLLGFSRTEAVGSNCGELLQAILPDGRRLCSRFCDARGCFERAAPFRSEGCLARRKDGSLVRIELGSLCLWPARNGCTEPIALVLLRPLEGARAEAGDPADRVQVVTLGRFRLTVGGTDVACARWPRKQALTLFKFLLTSRGRAVHRERLMDLLWPEVEERAGRERLKVTVYFLRRALRQAGLDGEILETAGESYLLAPDRLEVDRDRFERQIAKARDLARRGHRPEARALFEEAVEVYRGDDLEEDLYADWCAEERERLREVYLDALHQLAELCAAEEDHDAAIHVCRKALAREPCRESFHRALMRSLCLAGRRDEAIAQYESCRRILKAELGVEPMPETRALLEELLRARSAAPSWSGARSGGR